MFAILHLRRTLQAAFKNISQSQRVSSRIVSGFLIYVKHILLCYKGGKKDWHSNIVPCAENLFKLYNYFLHSFFEPPSPSLACDLFGQCESMWQRVSHAKSILAFSVTVIYGDAKMFGTLVYSYGMARGENMSSFTKSKLHIAPHTVTMNSGIVFAVI